MVLDGRLAGNLDWLVDIARDVDDDLAGGEVGGDDMEEVAEDWTEATLGLSWSRVMESGITGNAFGSLTTDLAFPPARPSNNSWAVMTEAKTSNGQLSFLGRPAADARVRAAVREFVLL